MLAQCFVLTFLKAMIRIMLVTNTAIPPMRENKANTIRALRTETEKTVNKPANISDFYKSLTMSMELCFKIQIMQVFCQVLEKNSYY